MFEVGGDSIETRGNSRVKESREVEKEEKKVSRETTCDNRCFISRLCFPVGISGEP